MIIKGLIPIIAVTFDDKNTVAGFNVHGYFLHFLRLLNFLRNWERLIINVASGKF